MVFPIGPLSFNSVIARPNDDKLGKDHWKHLAPRLTRTRSLPADHPHVGSPPGKAYEDVHRRNLLALGLFLTAAQCAEDADAGQSNSALAGEYYERTANLVGEIRDVLDTDVTSEDNLEKLENFKRDANAYVADYRRLVSPGQKSFAEVYGVVTALIGHFTSFGLGKKAFPAKLKDKQQQRLSLAERLLEREQARERKVAAVPAKPSSMFLA